MRASLNLVRELSGVEATNEQLIEKIGAQLGAIDEVVDISTTYQGIIIVKVMGCEKHPNADKLSLCLINDGGVAKNITRDEKGLVQVVCGAPNVRQGQTVAWLPPGTTVPSSLAKDPFVIESREIRGVTSDGMLASPAELNISDSHEGLLILEDDRQLGELFSEAYELNDVIIEIENKMFTHRPDCFGLLGVAREVAGIFQKPFTSPNWYKDEVKDLIIKVTGDNLSLSVDNHLPKLVPRFMVAPMSGVTVNPSPAWLQINLMKLGIRPLNNVVDITNYMMVLTGQPIHAFDYDKLASKNKGQAALAIRHPHDGELITLLNGKTIEPHKKAILIAAGDSEAVAIGGVMGGADTEVSDSTKNLVIECATFDMYSIRKTAMEHGLFTDAVTRFTKGQSPLQNNRVLAETLRMLSDLSGGVLAGQIIDDNHLDKETTLATGSVHPPLCVEPDFINALLGTTLWAEEMVGLLRNVEFESHISHGSICVDTPFWRTDIAIAEDVVEEVARLKGYDSLPLVLPSRDLTPAIVNKELDFKSRLRDILSRAGANEVLTYSFIDAKLLEASGQDLEQTYHIRNALSPSLQYYRPSLLSSLLDKVHANQKAGYPEFSLFELGRAHVKNVVGEQELPAELPRLSMVLAKNSKSNNAGAVGAAYFGIKTYLDYLLNELAIGGTTYTLLKHETDLGEAWRPATGIFEPLRSAAVRLDGEMLGLIGEPKASVSRRLKLPSYTGILELDYVVLTKYSSSIKVHQPLNRYPGSTQDISLKVSNDTTYSFIEEFIRQQLESEGRDSGYGFNATPVDIYSPELGDTKTITIRILLWHPDKTLTDQQFNEVMDRIAIRAESVGAERI